MPRRGGFSFCALSPYTKSSYVRKIFGCFWASIFEVRMEFGRVTIVGVGLIGGSIGLGLKERGLVQEVVGVGRRESSLKKASGRGAIDTSTLNLAEGCQGAEIVVLAVPVSLIAEMARRAMPRLAPGTIITDVGSTKAAIVNDIERFLREEVHFIGGHPLAGSEKRGVGFARSDLFEGARTILTPTQHTSDAALKKISTFWRSLGAKVSLLSPEEHDHILAHISHLPHLVAMALVGAVPEEALSYAASGFKDTTRIAASDPEIWRDILLSNKEEVLKALKRFRQELEQKEKCLMDADQERLLKLLKSARKKRETL